jgi:hypothetical protein
MEDFARCVVIGAVVATAVLLAYYPAIVAVSLMSLLFVAPPPRGPLPSETALRHAAWNALSYPSRLAFGPQGRSWWAPINPVAHALVAGVLAGVVAAIASRRAGRLPPPPPGDPTREV